MCAHFVGILHRFYWPHAVQFHDTYFFKVPKSALPNYKSISVCANVFTSDGSKPSQARVCAHFVGIICRFYWPHAVQFHDISIFKVPKFALPDYKSISVCANGFTSDESKPNRGKPSQARTYFRIVGAYIF